jgi:hypothetical protein
MITGGQCPPCRFLDWISSVTLPSHCCSARVPCMGGGWPLVNGSLVLLSFYNATVPLFLGVSCLVDSSHLVYHVWMSAPCLARGLGPPGPLGALAAKIRRRAVRPAPTARRSTATAASQDNLANYTTEQVAELEVLSVSLQIFGSLLSGDDVGQSAGGTSLEALTDHTIGLCQACSMGHRLGWSVGPQLKPS